MPRPPKITPADITLRLQVSGPQRSSDLATALGVNQSQISRRLAALGSDAILRLGAGPRTRYALRRRVRDLGDSWPVFRIGADGHATEWARLNVLHGGCQLAWSGPPPAWADRLADPEGFGDGLPCFLADLRPQGFLGRLIARRHAAALAVAPDPGQWNDDDTLVYLQAAGDDCPGDLLVGEMPLRRFQERRLQGAVEREAIPDTERGTRYGDLAAATLAGDVPGSSAGGEQPKFVTTLAGDGGFHPVLVKFSPVRDAAANRRWADLLVAEYHALAVLANHGQAAPHARLIESAGRLFLEVRRHDRSGAYGRIGQISLSALHAGLPEASARDWPGSADDLRRAGLIDDATVRDIRCLAIFGGLIGNTDMHFGNLSFFLDDATPLRLTPAYDMLPMLWRPGAQGEIIPREFTVAPPLPADRAAGWDAVTAWALDFWRRVSADERITRDFRRIAIESGETVARLVDLFGERSNVMPAAD
ncbi:type II toxin-antitoxin system HipA family toxinoxin YjjJ [Opitutaceae bacterium TAV4]|nr:type II toxin-antitoxin system HipA family toxinoxin YjjJ [Opitutaceae bacterium TAV4]RRK00069.1 type II toxin-antitoxin system HipA family toxinoxin YjjJ [Opitutaceae bacterium TAV3]